MIKSKRKVHLVQPNNSLSTTVTLSFPHMLQTWRGFSHCRIQQQSTIKLIQYIFFYYNSLQITRVFLEVTFKNEGINWSLIIRWIIKSRINTIHLRYFKIPEIMWVCGWNVPLLRLLPFTLLFCIVMVQKWYILNRNFLQVSYFNLLQIYCRILSHDAGQWLFLRFRSKT